MVCRQHVFDSARLKEFLSDYMVIDRRRQLLGVKVASLVAADVFCGRFALKTADLTVPRYVVDRYLLQNLFHCGQRRDFLPCPLYMWLVPCLVVSLSNPNPLPLPVFPIPFPIPFPVPLGISVCVGICRYICWRLSVCVGNARLCP